VHIIIVSMQIITIFIPDRFLLKPHCKFHFILNSPYFTTHFYDYLNIPHTNLKLVAGFRLTLVHKK